MRVITSQKLQSKYPGQNVGGLLKKLSPTVDILPSGSYTDVKTHCDGITEEILIVGNHDVVEYASLPNPAVDPDTSVYSDNPYGCTQDATNMLPNKVVARIPDEMGNPSWEYLETVVNNQSLWASTKSKNTGWVNIVASVWKGVSDYLNAEFAMQSQYVSPPSIKGTVNEQILSKQYSYINSHGTKSNGNLYGQLGNTFPVLMSPTQGYFGNTLAWFDACYGFYTVGRDRTQSIPMMALYSNAVAIIGSTCVAYGPSSPPLQAADLLMEKFFKRALNHEPLGSALMNAKKDFASATIEMEGGLSGSERKTLLQFCLAGNPLITI